MPKQKRKDNKQRKAVETKPQNIFVCETCKSRDMTMEQALEHLDKAHDIDGKTTRCSRTRLAHVDAKTWYLSDYRLSFGEGSVVMRNHVVMPRAKDDLMRFA